MARSPTGRLPNNCTAVPGQTPTPIPRRRQVPTARREYGDPVRQRERQAPAHHPGRLKVCLPRCSRSPVERGLVRRCSRGRLRAAGSFESAAFRRASKSRLGSAAPRGGKAEGLASES